MNRFNKSLLMAFIASATLISVSHAEDPMHGPGPDDHGREGHPPRMHGPMDPARAEKQLERMIDHRVPDATPEQKTRLLAIAKSAMADMKPLREQMHAARAESKKLLAQPTIDRAAIEAARVKQMALHDACSKRMSKAWADAAEVLTPAQRAKVAERMGKRGEHMRMRGPR